MSNIKFTRDMIERLSKEAGEVTEGLVGLSHTGSSTGSGVRFFNKTDDKVWVGSKGAREAAAYLIGGALEYISSKDDQIPDRMLWMREVQDVYSTEQRYRNWEQAGRDRVRRDLKRTD